MQQLGEVDGFRELGARLLALPVTADADVEPAPPRCHVCVDTGFVRRDVPTGHPDFGKAHPCPCRTSDPGWPERQRQRRLAACGIPAELRDQTLGTYQPVDGAGPVLAAARQFVAAFAEGGTGRWLVLLGVRGTGKSHLAAGIAAAVALQHEADVRWWDTRVFLDRLAADDFAEDAALMGQAGGAALLVLDEFGSQQDTDWKTKRLEQLLMGRWDHGRATVIVATRDLDQFGEWSPPLASRWKDRSRCQVAILECPDYRPRLRGA